MERVVVNQRMYIAITTFYPLVGGAETQTLAQAQCLRERGYEPTIVTFCHKQDWLPRDVVGGVPVIRVAGKLLGNRKRLPHIFQRCLYVLAMLVMSWVLWRQRKHYDILQVCQLSLLVWPLALVCRITGKPMTVVVISAGAGKVVHSHEPARLIAGPLDATASWLQVDGNTWVDGDLDGLASMGKFVVYAITSLLNRISAVVIVLSTRMKHQFVTHDARISDIQCIPNGVDVSRFHPVSEEIVREERTQTVICVSRLRYEKGIDVLLQAWRLVHIQNSLARLVIVGNGPIQKQLEYLADELGIAGSVEFTGVQNDVTAQLHRGLVAVLPSRWEGMSNALLEAMACGLACVATRVSGSEDLIQHEINGLLVEPENYQEMADALLRLLADPALVQCYGQASYELITKHYTLEHIADRYIGLYQKLIERKQQAKQVWPETVLHS